MACSDTIYTIGGGLLWRGGGSKYTVWEVVTGYYYDDYGEDGQGEGEIFEVCTGRIRMKRNHDDISRIVQSQ